jgi:hypothetical protein
MYSKELTAILALLQRLLAEPGLEPARRERLRKGRRELKKVKQSGKLDQVRIFRATFMITSTLAEMLPRHEE